MKASLKLVTLILSLFICLNLYSAQNISKVTYKWTDDNGVVQYTERPPKNRAYKKITVNASGGQDVTEVTAEEAKAAAEDTTQSALDEVVKANERNCKIATQNMEVLRNMARIRVTENGEERILSPQEKQARMDETQKQIDIYCKDINTN